MSVLRVSVRGGEGLEPGGHGLRAKCRQSPQGVDLAAEAHRAEEAALRLGLAPLPQSADAAQADAYLDAELATEQLLFGCSRTR
ncbi:hypothetical protein [Streptomyces sp. NPDC057623]|uniref:hypothetical protein n=1 Tax=Streptomyces sp. NPDC057623 TaxID=3346187 RepID=UPI0036B61BDF